MKDLSIYTDVFCDSLQALDFAYRHGLSDSARIYTSSPAMLHSGNPKILHIEKRWSIDELSQFQSTIQKTSEDVFDATLNIDGVSRECALAVAQTTVKFHKVLYKSACLDEDDFFDKRLFIRVEGNEGNNENFMNPPWEELLCNNALFLTINCELQDDGWSSLTTKGVNYLKRFKISGFDTVIYRIGMRIMKYIPNFLFNKEVLVPNENELTIEIVSSLIKYGVKVKEIKPATSIENITENNNLQEICSVVLPIMQERIAQWVLPSAVNPTLSFFKKTIENDINHFDLLILQWSKVITRPNKIKRIVLMNSPSNRSGHALSYVCRINHIPFISANHGVTVEISRLHGEISVGFDSSVGNVALCANYKLAQVASRSHFDYAKKYVVGMSNRHIAVRCTKKVDIATIPIIYVSYNIYRGNIGQFISFKTDYSSSIWEKNIINKVFSKLPYKVCYKTYPEETRRYADTDPVLQDIHASENITLLSDKVDMRYLTDPYSVLVSTVATSTLGWLVMSGKPVVFINQKNKGALTDDAYTSISKGIFVFDGDENNFHKNLVDFLSKPLSEIERLWEDKKCARKQMIKDYFTEYNYDGDAGKRAAKIITREYLT